MPLHTVTLNYDPAKADFPFGPNPRSLMVKPNDIIEFKIGESTLEKQAGCRLRITFHRDRHFSRSVLQHPPGQGGSALSVTVLPGAAPGTPKGRITAYRCELLDADGELIDGLSSDGESGGEIVPDTGG